MSISDKFGTIFDFLPETNLVEEYLYNHSGIYPVYSGQTEGQGILGFIDRFNQELPCVTFTTYGKNAGKLFYREGKYTIGRNCMGLRPKKQYANKINLKWFPFAFQNLFYRWRRGDIQGQGSLNRLLLERQPILIPDIDVQLRQLEKYQTLESIKQRINGCIRRLAVIQRFAVEYPPSSIIARDKLKLFMRFFGGNSGLTEEFIYENSADIDSRIQIWTSATLESKAMGFVSKNVKIDGGKLKTFDAPAILVARNGTYAGIMSYIPSGEFTSSDHAYVLTAKHEWKSKINLEWFIFAYQELFFKIVTSRIGNATFSKEYAERQIIVIPHIDYQNVAVRKLHQVREMVKKLQVLESKIDNALGFAIT